jgi:glioma pathogenesis-related protein 2
MIRRWLKEGRKYNFGTDGHKTTENFTQMVWQGSQEMGVGRAKSEDGNWYYGVVVFNPPGNIPNKYVNNVLMPAQA